ncbi:hypothetical protein KBB17_02790 [Candidatus Saccharibacteria bacterium]|jgi:antitoxin component of MazEF toxin-antitoxin module|nr:hypothetical protein [Candidatus Saccharibacteria bacterium]MBP9131751.1 hypothetical protein [Candidatus Saccharibacteria bacterium]
MIKSIQKVIKVGSSVAVTIPAKDVKRLGVMVGDEINVTFEPVASKSVDADKLELVQMTQKLIKRHKQALDSLNQR